MSLVINGTSTANDGVGDDVDLDLAGQSGLSQLKASLTSDAAGASSPITCAVPESVIAAPKPDGSSSGADLLANFSAMNGPRLGAQQYSYAGTNGPGPTNQAAGGTQVNQASTRTMQDLKDLARNPGAAHQEWKNLSMMEQVAVLEGMRKQYGDAFAQQFLDVAKTGKAQRDLTYYQPGTGPTNAELAGRGFKYAGKLQTGNAAFDVDVWVHPSGRQINKDVSTYKFGEPAKAGPAAGMPSFIDPNADRNKLFGEMIAMREDADAPFERGDMVLYQNGTAELFIEGMGGKSYVFVPIKGMQDAYAVYGPDGKRLNDKAWIIPKSEFPDPKTESVK